MPLLPVTLNADVPAGAADCGYGQGRTTRTRNRSRVERGGGTRGQSARAQAYGTGKPVYGAHRDRIGRETAGDYRL